MKRQFKGTPGVCFIAINYPGEMGANKIAQCLRPGGTRSSAALRGGARTPPDPPRAALI